MAKIKHKNAQLNEGIVGSASGTTNVIEFVRDGVIRGLKNSIPVKRPNQYSKRMK